MKYKIYIVNDKPFKSLDDIPENLTEHIQRGFVVEADKPLEDIKSLEDLELLSEDISIRYIDEKNNEIKSFRFFLYCFIILLNIISMIILRSFLDATEGTRNINFIIGFIISYVVGDIAYRVAQRKSEFNMKKFSNISFKGTLSLPFKEMPLIMNTLGLSLIINLFIQYLLLIF